MLKVIMSTKGAGKTKEIIDLVTRAADEENGDVVCIEKDAELTYDIPYRVRLIQATHYGVASYESLKGFLCGLHAGNYDITHIFIDGLLKILGVQPDENLEKFLDWCDQFSVKENVKFTITISSAAEEAAAGIRKYF